MVIKDPVAWISFFGCLTVAGILLRPENRRFGNMRWISPRLYFGIAYTFANVFVPFNMLITGRSSRGILLEREINIMLLASIISGISFLGGWQLASKKGFMARRPSYVFASNQYIARAVVLLPIIIGALVAFYQGIQETEWKTIYIFARSSFVVAGCMLIIAAMRRGKDLSRYMLLGGSGFIILTYLWLAFKQSSRFVFLFLFISILALVLYNLKKIRLIVIVLIGLAFVWFFMVYGNARYFVFSENRPLSDVLNENVPRNLQGIYEWLFLSGDLDAFENGTLVMHMIPDRADFYYGKTFLTLLVLPIPRALWPEKPIASVNYLLSDYYGFYSDNFAISLQAETYANFYWFGVVAIFIILGALSAGLFQWASRHNRNPETWFYLGLFSAYLILVERGSFHSMTSYYLMIVFWVLTSGLLVKQMSDKKRFRHYIVKRAYQDI